MTIHTYDPDNLESNKEAEGGAQGTQGSSKNCTKVERVCPLCRAWSEVFVTRIIDPPLGGPDCAVMCNSINIHTYIHTLDVRLVDVPAGFTQEEGHTGFLIRLPSAVLASIFLARRIQPFLSLVDREVEFCVRTNYKSFSTF